MKTSLVVALASIALVASLQFVATAGVNDPLPCRPSADGELVDKVKAHGNGGRARICQVGSDTALATVTKRTEDDSVAAVRHVINLQLRNGAWRVIMDLHIQRCQAGRGHQTFSRESCV